MTEWYPVTQYGADRREAETNDDRLHEESMKRKPKQSDRVVPVCMTCGEKYDVEFVKGSPVFYDHQTRNPHGCKS